MSATLLKILPINNLLGEQFYVPSYQRGYRWTTRQVQELLDDIWTFRKEVENKSKEEFYCLQPLVVSKQGHEWVLIDGQQRLTTIYLILTYLNPILTILGKNKYTLKYETRVDSSSFLDTIDLSRNEENVDYFHICQAYVEIDKWFKGKDGNTKINFLNTLLNDEDSGKNVKVIWYEIGSDINPIEIFTRINIGKIPLTNSELVKALFLGKLKENTNKASRTLKQLQIATEWDKIENTLQNDSFWYFIFGGGEVYDTRIDFIFDLMEEKKSDHEKYYTFYKFNERFDSGENADEIWLSIKKYFQTFEEWYNDTRLYHLVGYLIANGQSVDRLKRESLNHTKTQFRDFLISEITKTLDFDIASLQYGSNQDKKIRQVLLLFNIQMILANEHSNIRFPFDSYKTERWDIEHIRSVKSDKPAANKQRKWLECVLEYYIGKVRPTEQESVIDNISNEAEQELSRDIWRELQKGKIDDGIFTTIYNKVLNAFKEDSEPLNINSIANLTLLSENINRSYKNAVYPVKRKTIIDSYMEGAFVPLGTKNAFLKLYSSRFNDLMYWRDSDAKEYLAVILKTLFIYQSPTKTDHND